MIVVNRVRSLARLVVRRVAQLRLAQTATNLAFLSMLALVPVFTIALSLLGATPMFGRLREALLRYLSANFFLPSFSDSVVRYLNQFAAKAGQLSLIGGLAFFATAFTALYTIDRTLNQVWQVRRPRPLARRLTLYWTFLTLGPLLLAATLTVNGLIVSELFGGTRLQAAERLWLLAFPWIASVVGLTLLYRLVPHAPVRWRDALIGAVLATIALELLKRGLGLQLSRLPTYTIVYGAFAALPVFLIWVYLVWLIILAAAVLTASLPAWGIGVPGGEADTPAAVFERSAEVLGDLATAHARGESGLRVERWRGLFHDDALVADETARRLAALGYLRRMWQLDVTRAPAEGAAVWQEWWQLSPDAWRMTLRPLAEDCWHRPLANDGAATVPRELSARWPGDGRLGQPLGEVGPGAGPR